MATLVSAAHRSGLSLEDIAEVLHVGVGGHVTRSSGEVGSAVLGPRKLPTRLPSPRELYRVVKYFKFELSARDEIKAVASALGDHDPSCLVNRYHHGWQITMHHPVAREAPSETWECSARLLGPLNLAEHSQVS